MTKRLNEQEDSPPDFEEFVIREIKQDKEDSCPTCGEKLDCVDLGVRLFFTCDCGYRKTAKK
jgi:hypothetical protein